MEAFPDLVLPPTLVARAAARLQSLNKSMTEGSYSCRGYQPVLRPELDQLVGASARLVNQVERFDPAGLVARQGQQPADCELSRAGL